MSLIFYFALIQLFNRCIFGDSKILTTFWNVQTAFCKDYNFEQLLVQREINVNTEDKFYGDKIVIINNPGQFPSYGQDKNGTSYCVNCCIPSEANLNFHLDTFYEDIIRTIPDPNYHGLAIIRFEDWDPLFASNKWGDAQLYRRMTLAAEEDSHKGVWEANLEEFAERRFNKHAKRFFEDTLKIGKKHRPLAKWGYYNYPKCTKMDNSYADMCYQDLSNVNDNLMWLFNASDALFPTFKFQLAEFRKDYYGYPRQLIRGRLQETKRIAERAERKPKIYPYLSLKFVDNKRYLDEGDIRLAIHYIGEMDIADGVIMGLNEEELDNKNKCKRFYGKMVDFVERLNITLNLPNNNSRK